jgi:hypothetical protein
MLNVLFRGARRRSARQSHAAARRPFAPRLEVLEDRSLPSTLTVTNLADSGRGSLRGQLAAASPGDTIVFKRGLSGTIALGSTLTLDRNVSVVGNLDAAGNPLVTLTSSGWDGTTDLAVNPGVTASVSGLTLTGATEAAVFNRGSLNLRRVVVTGNWIGYYGIFDSHTGTVYNAGGTLVVQDSRVTDNHLTGAGSSPHGGGGIESGPYLGAAAALTVANSTVAGNDGGLNGGGIWISGGTATITGSTITGNSVSAFGGGIGGTGTFTLTVRGSTVSGNNASVGGGIFAAGGGTAAVTDTTVSGNTAQSGGGIYFGTKNVSTLASSTVANNQAIDYGRGGGGLFVADRSAATVINSTIAGNTTGSLTNGGGIYVASGSTLFAGGTLTLLNSTVANNRTAGAGGGLWIGATRTQVRLANTIVAGNTAAATGPDVFGPVLSTSAYNLIGDGSGASGLTDGSNGNQVGTAANPIDPRLGPLQDNGGPTWTLALLPGSPALDAGDNTDAPATDQRGLARVMAGRIDIGAFEVQVGPATQTAAWLPDALMPNPRRNPRR